MRKAIYNFLQAVAHPVTTYSHWVHPAAEPMSKRKRRILQGLLGCCIMVTSAWLSTWHQSLIPHALWDATTWLAHGFGSAPILRVFAELAKWEA